MTLARLKNLLLIACVVAGCRDKGGHAAVAAACTDHTISGTGVGALTVGSLVDSLERVCPVVRDTIELDSEAHENRVLSVLIGADTVIAEVDSARVWRIKVTSPAFATRDSLRVGTQMPRLAREAGAHGAVGEGRLFVLIPRLCGVSFRISEGLTIMQPAFDSTALRAMPSSLRVDQILVFGCSLPAT
jgi:hypothetical protein